MAVVFRYLGILVDRQYDVAFADGSILGEFGKYIADAFVDIGFQGRGEVQVDPAEQNGIVRVGA